MEKKPNAWELEGWSNIAAAIWLEAQYQDFNETLLSQAKDEEQRQFWIEKMRIGTEEHRMNHFNLMRMIST